MKKYLLLILGVILFSIVVIPSDAYVLSGYVSNSSGNPLANFPVELEDDAETIWLENTTNNNGYFEFSNLLQGLYELNINPGVEEESDCSVKNKVIQCYDITDKAVCENSYAEYCSDIGNQYCDLPEGRCEHFPCFWGEVNGVEGCYFSCDHCFFGINQSVLENYTSIEFEDEDTINLTGDLEINATLLKIDAKLKLNSSGYKNGDVIKANVTVKNNEAFNLINWGAVFGVWGENGDEEELYFNLTSTNLIAGQTKSFIFTYKIPENNTYDELYVFGGTGNNNSKVKSSQGNLTALTYKVDEEEIHIGDSDGDGINDDADNCPFHYNPKQGNITYAYDNFNDNILSPNWNIWKPDPNIAIREINNEVRIDGATSQQGWNTLQYNQNFNQDVEASIRVRTPIINESSAFSLIIRRGGPEWGYYRIMRHYWGYNIGGHFEGQDYWDSGIWRNLFGDEGGNFHTYKIIYKQSKQNMSFYLDNIHLLTIQNVSFYDFRFEFGGEGWQPNQNMDFRIDNFTIKEIGDFDNDNVGDICDNCPYDYNPQQEDSDGDGIGNICEPVKISGYVFNTSNNPLNVTVELEDGSETMELLKMTDKNGYFEFINVPKGYYEIYVNDDKPILWSYTGAGIGDDTPMLYANTDVQINFTLWKINLTFQTNLSKYHNGGVIGINATVSNNEIYDLENWEVAAELYFENNTHFEWMGEVAYSINLSSGATKSFLLLHKIPEDNKHNNLWLETWIWTDAIPLKSSKGLLQGELWQWQEKEIFIGEKTKFNFPLFKGWNLVSSPLNFTNVTEVFKPIEDDFVSMFAYDAYNKRFIEIDPFSVEEIDLRYGAWVKVSENVTLNISGKEFENTDIPLVQGWNLIGHPYLEEKDISELFDNTNVYAYNGSWSSYIPNRSFNSLQTLKSGYGYWVNIK